MSSDAFSFLHFWNLPYRPFYFKYMILREPSLPIRTRKSGWNVQVLASDMKGNQCPEKVSIIQKFSRLLSRALFVFIWQPQTLSALWTVSQFLLYFGQWHSFIHWHCFGWEIYPILSFDSWTLEVWKRIPHFHNSIRPSSLLTFASTVWK